ncbi:MAG TPA: sugar-binding domain-containing protein [Stellaceae bacterium]|nr:sugar-binding domain-containing protein [Stellaceae bacterium]
MPRLNIYLPAEVYELADRARDSANLSEICARAIRDELEAAASHRAAPSLGALLRAPTPLEARLIRRHHLAEAVVVEAPTAESARREALGRAAAQYLDRNLVDGAQLAIAGGRQSWCVARNLAPRRLRLDITALGVGQADAQLLHVHANTLTTLLWLLYSPRSTAHLIGAGAASAPWAKPLPKRDEVSYFLVASCAALDPRAPFARLIGDDAVGSLIAAGAVGDFAYLFFDAAGKPVPGPATAPQAIIPAPALRALAMRADGRIMLVAGGDEKLSVMRAALKLGLANMVVTDTETAERLLEEVP